MTYTNRTQRRTEAATERLDLARRQALVNAIGVLNRNRETSAAEILREILNKDRDQEVTR
jgi:rhamnose utilization protein RhaD (predicted bifunctional aldolase and dehydrogenase)